MHTAQNRETIALRTEPLEIKGAGADADIPLTREGADRLAKLYADTLIGRTGRIYMALENIRGTRDAAILKIYLHSTEPEAWQAEHLGDSISMFGLRRASSGDGLTSISDITTILNNLSAASATPLHQIHVHIQPEHALLETEGIVIGSIRLFIEY